MMLKLKVCFTIAVVYEILAVMLLHFPRVCGAMFSTGFCADSGFKYFIGCVAIPLVAFLIYMWIREIVVAARRRSFKNRVRAAVSGVASTLKNSVKDSVDPQSIEKYLTAAILAGAKRYADTHPKAKETFDNILNTVTGQANYYRSNSAPETDDDVIEDEELSAPIHRRPRAAAPKRAPTKSRSAKKRKK